MTGNQFVPIIHGLMAGALLSVSGCYSEQSSPTEIELADEPALGATWQQYRADAEPLAGGRFRAEWDLLFEDEAHLRAHYDSESTRTKSKLVVFTNTKTGYEPTFGPQAQTDIPYCVADSFGTIKAAIVRYLNGATQAWQDVANVHFRYASAQDSSCSSTNANVAFAVMPAMNPQFGACGANKMMWSGGCAVQDGGSSPLLRGVLLITTNAIANNGMTWTGIVRHELGHILGFRHEHPWRPDWTSACPELQSYDGLGDVGGRQLTAYDQTSVMHYPLAKCGGIEGTDYTISALDGEGSRQIYGMPVAWYQTVANR